MGDMMTRGMGGPPGMTPGGASAGPGPVDRNLSALNPNDMANMAASGRFNANMTVADYLKQMGIDVNGPVQQLVDFAQKQQQNANPINKMRNIASAGPALPGGGPPPQGAQPPGAPPVPQAPPGPSGLAGLMAKAKMGG